MDTRKIPVFCYWNGCIKDGPDGPFYEGSTPRVIRVESKTKVLKLLDDLHQVTGFEKGKFHIDVIGRYPSIVQQPVVKYVLLPVVDDSSLETMLEVPSYNPCINSVDLYLEVKPVSDEGVGHVDSSLANQAMRKRCRQEDADVNVSVRDNTIRRTPRNDNNNGWIEDESSTYAGNGGNNEAVPMNSNMKEPGSTNVVSDGASKQLLFSTAWLDERELRVGMLFKNKAELDKAVKLYSRRRQRKYSGDYELYSTPWIRRYCVETGQKKCGWNLVADQTKENGYEITEYAGPHTCEPVDVDSDFLAGEIEGLIKAHPSISIAQLNKWVKEEFGYTVSRANMWDAKRKAITAISGDSDKSFSVLPKFMASLCSSNKMRLEWQYDLLPDPKDASFRSVFWAFQQSIEGFPYCRPVIIVDTVGLSGKNCGKMLVAAGFDAENQLFPLAFAVISQERFSADSWRWFFACIRKLVTHVEGLCLITTLDPDLVTVVNEPECQWAQHRFCLRHLCFVFYDVFGSNLMTEFVYKAGSTGNVSSFFYYLKKIEEMNPEARKWLENISRHKWALAYDDGGLRFGIMETNLIFATYGFANYVRDFPITACILRTFDHLAELFISQRGLLSESLNNGDKYAKHVITKLEKYKAATITHDVLPLDNAGERFQVTEVMKLGNKRYDVHRIDRVCTCGIWQLYKYPCSHMLAVCRRLNIDHLQYVNDFYEIGRSFEAYAAEFNPVPGVSDWPEASEIPRLFPPGRLDCTSTKPN